MEAVVSRRTFIMAAFFAVIFAVFFMLAGGKGFAISGAPSNFHPDTTYGGGGASYTIVQVTGWNIPNANLKMKARSTLANIYVPKSMVNQVINITVLGGCDFTTRDNDSGFGSTTFRVVNGSTGQLLSIADSWANCGYPNVSMAFIATPPNPGDTANIAEDYNIYTFYADGNMIEAGSSRRYLNAFQISGDTPGTLVGVSDKTEPCDLVNYPMSCPATGETYSSFYGAWGVDPYAQRLEIYNTCNATGTISFYDLDASDASLTGQNLNIRVLREGQPTFITALNGAQMSSLPHAGIQNWAGGIPGMLSPHPGFGGNNNEYLNLPGGDPMFMAAANFEAFVRYTFIIEGISDKNAIQIRPTMTHCQTNPPTCTITSVTSMTNGANIRPGDRIRFSVTLANASSYILGVNGPTADPTRPNDPTYGVRGNYLVNGNQYVRAPTFGDGTYDVTLITYVDGGPYDQAMYAPLAPGTYQFNWGIVLSGVGWSPGVCDASFTVAAPDTAPTVSITQNCTLPFTITITVNDADYATNGGSPAIDYSVNSVAQAQVSSRNYVFNMPNGGLTAVAVSASSSGVLPFPPGGNAAINPTPSASSNFGPCAYTFNLTSQPRSPTLDDSEAPTSGDFTSCMSLTGGATVINGINTNREFFRNRGGIYNAAAGTVAGGANVALRAPMAVPNLTWLNGAPNPNCPILGTVSVIGFPAVSIGDHICLRLTTSPSTGLVNSSGNMYPGASGSSVSVQCTTVLSKPYLKVYGSDVMAGSGFGSSCTALPTTSITAFAKQISGYWIGAGTQLGAFAGGSVNSFINSFSTNMLNSPTTPNVRAFANTSAPAGNFGSSICMDDFWASMDSALPVDSNKPLQAMISSSPVGGQYRIASGQTIGAPIPISGKLALYIDGDVTIDVQGGSPGITTTTSWTSIADIPSVYIIARGNIYITPSVTRLDGVYVAMPNAASPLGGGRIFTCTDNGAAPSNAVLYGACTTNKLTINGWFAAKHVNFLRTHGTLSAAAVAPAPPPPTCTAANPVIIFTDWKFLGSSRALAEGVYSTNPATGGTAPVGYRTISSVKVPAGCRAVLTDETTGAVKELLADWTVINGTSYFNDTTTKIEVYSLPVAQRQLGLLWSYTGPIEPANYDCALFNEPSDSWWTGIYADNYVCARKSYNLGLSFSANGPIAGKTCVLVNEPSDANGWANNYLCTTSNLGLQFTSNGGAIGIAGMYCISVLNEPGDTHIPIGAGFTTAPEWADNYMCEPIAPVPPAGAVIASETSTSNNIAEVFNFAPEMLITTPATKPRLTTGAYDSVISLPPAL